MKIEFVGNYTTLSASSTGTLKVKYDKPGRIRQIMFYSEGAVRITNFYIEGGEDILTGTMRGLHFWESAGYVYNLPVPIEYSGNAYIVLELTDLSGASNEVAVTFVIEHE